jgi:glycosyltransferase involved in cell wall biosynthesis
MRILLSAASCSPYKGSEPAIGWKVSRELARVHEVHLLVFRYHEPELVRAKAEGLVPSSMHFHYVGKDWSEQKNPLLEKLQYWQYYRAYVREIRELARQLLQEHDFDVIQHVTFATWRTPVPLHGLGVPYVWGPVGGAERFPPALLGILSSSGFIFELVRYAANLSAYFSPSLRAAIRGADAVIASHPEVTRLLRRIRGTDAGLHELLVTAFTQKEREALLGHGKPARAADEPLRAFCGGLLEGRKGVSLAIRAIARAKTQGLRIEYRVSAKGPELIHLQNLTKRLGLEKEVIFQAPLRGSAYHQALRDADIYLLPSLRDNAPITLMEAMLAGCVPLVANCGGPAAIVTPACGILVPVTSPAAVITALAEALLELQADRLGLQRLGEVARDRILKCYTMEHYMEMTENIYRSISPDRISLRK